MSAGEKAGTGKPLPFFPSAAGCRPESARSSQSWLGPRSVRPTYQPPPSAAAPLPMAGVS